MFVPMMTEFKIKKRIKTMFNRKVYMYINKRQASTHKKWIKTEALVNKVQGCVERHKTREKRKGEKAVEKPHGDFLMW